MKLTELKQWAQSQANQTAEPEVRPDIGRAVLELVDEFDRLDKQLRSLQRYSSSFKGDGN